jgi:hypothetical protein
MKLYEIIGDDENIVYNDLKTIYLIIKTYVETPVRSEDFEYLYKSNLEKLHEDRLNLNYWVLTSDRISKLYSEIKNLI